MEVRLCRHYLPDDIVLTTTTTTQVERILDDFDVSYKTTSIKLNLTTLFPITMNNSECFSYIYEFRSGSHHDE